MSNFPAPMDRFQQLLILLPCHSFEDFPTHHRGEDAESLYACWSALWHPALLDAAGGVPAWASTNAPPEDLTGKCIAVPRVSIDRLSKGIAGRAAESPGCAWLEGTDRRAMLTPLFTGRPPGDAAADDFYALGFAYLQVQLMTRQLRYSSNLDDVYFGERAVAAARAAIAGRREQADAALHDCFDLLAQERDHYFSGDPHLIDLTLLDERTLGERLSGELEDPEPRNYLVAPELLARLGEANPAALERLRTRLDEGTASVCGGWPVAGAEPDQLTSDELFERLREAADASEAALGRPVRVFARRSGHIPGDLAAELKAAGYRGAVVADFEGGRDSGQHEDKLLWSWGGAEIDAVTSRPADAGQTHALLGLGPRLGESIDAGQIATALLVHWPGRISPAMTDLRRAARWGLALGRLWTLDAYFAKSERPFHSFHPAATTGRSEWLAAAVAAEAPDPLSAVARHYADRMRAEQEEIIRGMHALVGPTGSDGEPAPPLEALARRLADRGASDQRGWLAVNPTAHAARIPIAMDSMPRDYRNRAIYAAEQVEPDRFVTLADVPPLGFVRVCGGGRQPARRWLRRSRELAEPLLVRNEFLEAVIDPDTGHIASVHSPGRRGNRFSWELAHYDAGDADAPYSRMRLDEHRVTTATPVAGAVSCRGALVREGVGEVADYEITYSLGLGQRALDIALRIEPKVALGADPWRSNFCVRAAWPSEAAEVDALVRDRLVRPAGRRLTAPLGVHVDEVDHSLTVLAGGLPAHRRVGGRMLDTLLLVRGETCREFRIGYGFDLPDAPHAARRVFSPPRVTRAAPPADAVAAGWLLHVARRNVVVTALRALPEGDGVVVRLVESAGRMTRCPLRLCRPPREAHRQDAAGRELGNLKIEGDAVQVELPPHAAVFVAVRF